MKIVHVFPKIQGGLFNRMNRLIPQLRELDIQNIIIQNDLSTINNNKELAIVKGNELGCETHTIKNIKTSANGNVLLDCYESSIAQAYDKLFKDIKPNIVHFHNLNGLPYSIIQVAYLRGIKVFISFHDAISICPKSFLVTKNGNQCIGPIDGFNCAEQCYSSIEAEKLNIRHNYIIRTLNKYVDRIISVSNYVSNIHKTWGIEKEIDMIESAILIERSNTRKIVNKDNINILYVGGMNYRKGILILLEAFRRLKCKKYCLSIYGKGNEDYFEAIINEKYKDCNVEFKGFYNRDEVIGIYDEHDLLVVPSIGVEAYGLVVQEAAARNIPSIVSDVSGVSEWIENDINGWIFENGNITQLAELLDRLIIYPKQIQRVSDYLFNLELKTFKEFAENYFKLYLEEYNKDSKFGMKYISTEYYENCDLEIMKLSPQDIAKYSAIKLNKEYDEIIDIYIFGTGQMSDVVYKELDKLKFNIIGYFDNNKELWKTKKNNLKVNKPKYVKGPKVIVASSWRNEISRQLNDLGYNNEDIINVC